MPPVGLVWRYGGPMPQMGQQFQTELLLLQEMSPQGERMRAHRDALKARLTAAGANLPPPAAGAPPPFSLDETEWAVRCMIVGGRFAGTQGIPESAIIGFLPDKYVPHGQSGLLGEAIAGHQGLIRLHLKAGGCPRHS